MSQVSRSDVENIRNLTDFKLEYVLGWLCGVMNHRKSLGNAVGKANRHLEEVNETINSEANAQNSATGKILRVVLLIVAFALEGFFIYYRCTHVTLQTVLFHTERVTGFTFGDFLGQVAFTALIWWLLTKKPIVCVSVSIAFMIFAKPPFLIGVLYYLVPFLLILAILVVPGLFKTDEEREQFLRDACANHDSELKTAKNAVQQAENAYNNFINSPAVALLNSFMNREGYDLCGDDVEEMLDIVRGGAARTFPEARQVLAMRKNNREMQQIARDRAEQELEHQRRMQQLAQEQLREQQRSNREQQRTANDVAREAQRAADAEEERTRIAKEIYRDYKGY